MKIKQTVQKKARGEMIPLIDSMFLILVFFVYAMLSMVVHKGISVNLPEAATSVVSKEEYIAVSITMDGQKVFNKSDFSLKE